MPEKEAISTPHAAPPAGPYSQAVRWGNLVFTASVGSRDPRTGQPAPEGDIAQATRNALENLKAILEAAGTSLDHVLKVTLYLRRMDDFAAVNAVYATYFRPPLPARSLVVSAENPGPVGFDAIAYLPEPTSP